MKPILFSTPMIQAILAGRKTQTRRVIKTQPVGEFRNDGMFEEDGCYYLERLESNHPTEDYWNIGKPRYQIGNVLYVRETWQTVLIEDMEEIYLYKADGKDYSDWKSIYGHHFVWRPSIYMPQKAARILLKVKLVRAERLQDITEEDAKAEGFENIGEFSDLWDKLNVKRGYPFDSNPWAWVYEFERINP